MKRRGRTPGSLREDGVRVYSAGGERWKETRVSLTNAVVLLAEGPGRDWHLRILGDRPRPTQRRGRKGAR
jgi:hypothetical protein